MEPKQDTRPATRRSLLALALLVVAVGASHALLVSCGGGGSQQTSTTTETTTSTGTTPTPAPTDTSVAAVPAAGGGDVAAGAKIYTLRCTPCHGPMGKGDGPLGKSLSPKPRDHTNSAYMKSQTDEQLLAVIRDGKGAMPGWGKTGVLTEKEIHDALAYIRTLVK